MRVLSLVPSATETLLAIGVTPVACTRFCEQPGIPTVGGTKNPDRDAIVAAGPDLVVMNDEENRREDHDALVGAGIDVHSMSPRSVADVGPAVAALAGVVGVDVPDPFGPATWSGWLADEQAGAPAGRRQGATLVWRRPWMTLADDTYGASVLALLGVDNVVGRGSERYPEIALSDVAARAPDVVLLPSEPYVFRERHVGEVEAEIPNARVRLIDGRDLFWWGVRTPTAVARLRVALA